MEIGVALPGGKGRESSGKRWMTWVIPLRAKHEKNAYISFA